MILIDQKPEWILLDPLTRSMRDLLRFVFLIIFSLKGAGISIILFLSRFMADLRFRFETVKFSKRRKIY